ncbi:AAA family ATPase [Limibaculum sp. M0105]|uniref:Chromosome partition protein Smc n=1 Tax=Thermohalobaculum xanthum TaxID=2753746 RepID=A0A8J7MAW2_9RHOB|nr:AAA family ATPase [Thermohalobaculum xanthum]MBK0401010.1 AAA family ATPase [Thermohalobaculum xanthum]
MQFTRLRLQGFKSFVDPTELVIRDGLTGVVGPNGCGKSNLLEALRWVMGENRAKAMRGDGMEDVIFAGTASRPARNSASVDLVIDNTDRLAPATFNHSDSLEISRRITRDIGSAYTLNGKNVRARDVQMLFADASTGAHSPALVRQGQISELINAKPKARRRILEEAAGISGLYQRRHEAELKLNGAEQNLARVEDVLEGLETQLRSLERQAAQAKRYREIAGELRRAEAVLLYLRWQQAESARRKAEDELAEGVRAAARAETEVSAARRTREEAEEALPPLREEEAIAAAVHQRLSIERDRLAEEEARARAEIERLAALARQIAADREREETLGRDAHATIGRLTEEETELSAAHEGHDALQAQVSEAARAAGEKLAQQETVLDRLTEEAARLAARAAAAERRLAEARGNQARLLAEIERAEAAEAALAAEIDAAETVLAQAVEAEARARAAAEEAEAALEAAEARRASAQSAESEARGQASETEGALSALSAEVQGLERLLARDRGDGAQLLDQVSVAAGFEAALGAALGDDLRASSVADAGATGWLALDPYPAPGPLPAGAAPIAPHVKAPAELSRRLQHVGVVDRAEGARLQPLLAPGQRLVSREGDLWRWDGYCQRAEDAPSAAALRLQQKNRLAALREAEAEARAARDEARAAHAGAREALDAAARAEQDTRSRRRAADQSVAETARAMSKAEADLEMRRGRLETQRGSLAARRDEMTAAAEALAEAEGAVAELDDVGEARAAVERQRGEVDLARTAMLAARGRADEIRREALAREKRLAEIARERKGWQDRLDNASSRLADLDRRGAETAEARKGADALPDEIVAKAERLMDEIETAETRRRAASDKLSAAETALRRAEATEREAERAASDRREARARLQAVLEGAGEKVEETSARIREDLEIEPEALAAELAEVENLPPVMAAETDVARLRRQRDALGAVNLRAEEDAREVAAERDNLAQEKADLDAAISKLRGGIAELNREGRERIVKAFDSVNEKFARLFRHLFGGGEARLVMVESDDPLDAGLEILCQPPGKKLSTLSLLSGGEQTLTALSLIFAVFLSNPAPICVLDEVDAPLDDSNVSRFCDLLDEMCRVTTTRFLIITHHAITMSRMDRLFGVTMVEKGVSQLVSVDLARAAEMVDA